jgi:hypothetical protein
LVPTNWFWQFFQLVGSYQGDQNHQDAFRAFAKRVELVAQSSLESFKIKIIQEKENIAITGTEPEKG